MAVVLPMAASAHHPSLRPRRLSTTSSAWTSGTPTTNGTHIHQHHPHQPRSQFMFPGHNPRIRPSPSRTRSASTVASRTPSSSPSRYSSASPKMSAGSMGAGGTTSAAGPSALNGHHLSSGMLGTVSVTSSSTGHRTRRPRRRADEVERLYKCTWNGCEKSYGTLSHLNDHVRLQRHGNKREPHEFKEARRIWRQERKSRRLREHAATTLSIPASAGTRSIPSTTSPAGSVGYSVSTSATATNTNSNPNANPNTNSGRILKQREEIVTATTLGDEASSSPEEPELLLFPHTGTRKRIAAASGYHTQSTTTNYYSPATTTSIRGQGRMQHDTRELTSFQNIHEIRSPRSPSPLAHQHRSAMGGPSHVHDPEPQKGGFRLPSIAELRLDLSLDEYEAHAALGSLSSASPARPPAPPAPPPAGEYHSSRSSRNRKRDSWYSPSTSSNTSQYPTGPGHLGPLAPPQPYHHSHNHEPSPSSTNPTLSPDLTNQYRFRVSAPPSATTSPSLDRPSSRTMHPHSQGSHGQYPPYSRTHSRNVSSSRPSTSATTTTTQSYPPSSFPFIPAQPPRVTPETAEGEPRRKRRKYEEIERRYLCGWNGCQKAYGTLNHLNDHVSLQGHGPKRRSSEFA